MAEHIVVPLDGSPFGETALPLARSLAARSAAQLQLVHVHETIYTSYVDGGPIIDEEMDRASRANEETYMETMRQKIAAETSASVSATVLDGAVAKTIAHYAETLDAAYIVLTSHGRGGIARLWLGSVADSLLRHSTVPLIMLRPAQDEQGNPASQQRETVRHMLVALDGSARSEQVLSPSLRLGAIFDAEYTLLQVVDDLAPASRTFLPPTERSQRTEPHRSAAAHAYLERVNATLAAEGFRARTCVVSAEQPAVAILREARERNCDLVALATHGRGGVTRLLLGSVADKVLRGAEDLALLVLPARHAQPDDGQAAISD